MAQIKLDELIVTTDSDIPGSLNVGISSGNGTSSTWLTVDETNQLRDFLNANK